jgi:hypothetical protein
MSFRARHHDRAVLAIAGHLCSRELTDGFCGPGSTAVGRDPCCRHPEPRRRDCVKEAEGVLEALETRGMVVAWAHDRQLPQNLRTLLGLLGGPAP